MDNIYSKDLLRKKPLRKKQKQSTIWVGNNPMVHNILIHNSILKTVAGRQQFSRSKTDIGCKEIYFGLYDLYWFIIYALSLKVFR